MDVLGLVSMKDAANCDKQYDLQISKNHQLFERERYPLALLQGMFSSVLQLFAIVHSAVACIGAVSNHSVSTAYSFNLLVDPLLQRRCCAIHASLSLSKATR
jgi:hypothetical protein